MNVANALPVEVRTKHHECPMPFDVRGAPPDHPRARGLAVGPIGSREPRVADVDADRRVGQRRVRLHGERRRVEEPAPELIVGLRRVPTLRVGDPIVEDGVRARGPIRPLLRRRGRNGRGGGAQGRERAPRGRRPGGQRLGDGRGSRAHRCGIGVQQGPRSDPRGHKADDRQRPERDRQDATTYARTERRPRNHLQRRPLVETPPAATAEQILVRGARSTGWTEHDP